MPERFLHRIDQSPAEVAPRRALVRRLLEDEKPLTQKNIQAYVDGLIQNMKKFDDPHEKATFLLQDLQTDLVVEDATHIPPHEGSWEAVKHILKQVFYRNTEKKKSQAEINARSLAAENRADMDFVLHTIRRAVVEELKKQLNEACALGHIHYSDVQFILGAINEKYKHIARTKDVSGKTNLLRSDKGYYKGKELRFHKQAVDQLMSMMPQDHIIPIKGVDRVRYETLAPELELHDMQEFLEGEVDNPAEAFGLIRDCMLGAHVLERHGLVLQDIKLNNLGYVTRYSQAEQKLKKVGVLFDLEGIYPSGMALGLRISGIFKQYDPPELLRKGGSWQLFPSEMIFQFGQCLQETLSLTRSKLPEPIWEEGQYLVQHMKAYDKNLKDPVKYRLGFSTAIKKLNEIIRSLEETQRARVAA